MKKSHIAIEYLIKLIIVGIIAAGFIFGSYFATPLIVLAFLSWPLFCVVSFLLFLILWITPFAKREGSFKTKYIIVPAIPLGIIAAIALLILIAIFAYNKIKYFSVANEINEFVENADEVLVYRRDYEKGNTYPDGIMGSDVTESSVFIDYDSMEIAFVFYDWSFKDTYEKFKFEPMDSENIEYIMSDDKYIFEPFSAPYIGDIYMPQSITKITYPGSILISYYQDGNGVIARGDTIGLVIIMADDSMWVSKTARVDLNLDGYNNGVALLR